MGDLHSVACNSTLLQHSSSLGWDLHTIGIFNTDGKSQFMESIPFPAAFFSPFDSDLSTGYLEDAIFEFSCKRRRLQQLYSSDKEQQFDPIRSIWNLESTQNYGSDQHDYFSLLTAKDYSISGDETVNRSSSVSRTSSEEASVFTSPEEQGMTSVSETYDSSSSSPKNGNHSAPRQETQRSSDRNLSSGGGEKRKKKMIGNKVLYPFDLVKPGGSEGDLTLSDINERMLMPPARPVRHPVGNYACRPLVSPDGPGLSGKAVVALTKIHTRGRGTITIIRTRG